MQHLIRPDGSCICGRLSDAWYKQMRKEVEEEMDKKESEAVQRVREFVEAREQYHAQHSNMLHPGSIHSAYGRLDMVDLKLMCDMLDDT